MLKAVWEFSPRSFLLHIRVTGVLVIIIRRQPCFVYLGFLDFWVLGFGVFSYIVAGNIL